MFNDRIIPWCRKAAAKSDESFVELISFNNEFLWCSSSNSFWALLSHIACWTISDVADDEGIRFLGKPAEDAAAEAAAAVICAINDAIASLGTSGGKVICVPSTKIYTYN